MPLTIPLVYAITVCGIFVALLLLRLIPIIVAFLLRRLIPITKVLVHLIKRFPKNHIKSFLLRNIVYPFLYRRFPFLAPITRLRALGLVIYTSVTVYLNLKGVQTGTQASIRAGWLSVTNLIPLFVSGRVAMAANALGLSLREVFAVHTATGFMVVVQAITHVSLELRNSRLRLDKPVPFYGFLVALFPHRRRHAT